MSAAKVVLGCLTVLCLLAVGQGLSTAWAGKGDDYYVVVIKKVQVHATNEKGNSWDINDGKPDLIVQVQNVSEKGSKAFETKEATDTFSFEFNTPTPVKVKADQVLKLRVLDKDVAGSETIGETEQKIPAKVLEGGTFAVGNFGRVMRLELAFKKL
jgi:hypothetical protein